MRNQTKKVDHFKAARPLNRREKASYWKRFLCEDVPDGCPDHVMGFVTIVPNEGPQAQYIRERSGRRYVEEVDSEGLVTFTFYAGQQCWTAHELPNDNNTKLTIERSDKHGNLFDPQTHNLEDWTDQFNESRFQTRKALERG